MVIGFALRSSAMRRRRSDSVSLREFLGLPRYWVLRWVSFCFCTVLAVLIFSDARRSYFSLYLSSSTCEALVSTILPSVRLIAAFGSVFAGCGRLCMVLCCGLGGTGAFGAVGLGPTGVIFPGFTALRTGFCSVCAP